MNQITSKRFSFSVLGKLMVFAYDVCAEWPRAIRLLKAKGLLLLYIGKYRFGLAWDVE